MAAQVGPSLSTSEQAMRDLLGQSIDVTFRSFVTSCHGTRQGLLVFITGLAEEQKVEAILAAVTRYTSPPFRQPEVAEDPAVTLKEAVLSQAQLQLSSEIKACVEGVLLGQSAIFIEGSAQAILIDTGWNPGRGVQEPSAEAEVRGPRDGMVEHLPLNLILLRRRVVDARLRVQSIRIGRRTSTQVAMAYLEGVAPEGMVEEVRQRIARIDIDALHGSGPLEEMIRDSPYTVFPTTMVTERPDRLAASILEGRVGLIVDGTPFAVILPTTLWQLLQAPGDYYQNYLIGTAFRWVRLIALVAALTLPSVYVLLTTFHHEMIPTPLALSIASGREGTPLPTIIEVLLMEIMFEVMHEAGLRLPRAVGQTVSIVGALVIGEAAVQAGLVAPATVIVIATAGITGFALPAYNLSLAARLVRFPLLLLSGTAGVFGFITGSTILALHLLSIRSFGLSYLSPLSPYRGPEQADTLVRIPWWRMRRRPALGGGVTVRQPPGQQPQPPGSGSL